MTLRQRIRFYQQLAVLARAGVSFRVSLERLRDRITGRQVTILSEKVNAGDRLNEAFEAAGFSAFECHLVAAGERSGQLDTIFEHLSDYWGRDLAMRQALIRPLYYPIVVLHLALFLGAAIEMMTLTWPVAVFHLVMALVTIYFVGFVVYMVLRASWANEAMLKIWLWVPIVGSSLKAAFAYRWITALKLEFSAGISLSRAVADAWRASGYVDCERIAEEGEQAMRDGMVLSALMQQWRQLPRDWIDFVETGEVSGALEAAFTNLETEAARSWKLAQERMAEWLPKIVYFVVLIVVAAVVGRLVYNVEIAPSLDAIKQIDDATK